MRFAIVQSRTRGPSGEKVLCDQLAGALQVDARVRACRLFVTDRFPGDPRGAVSAELLGEIRAARPDVVLYFSVWGPPLPLRAKHVFIHCNMWRGGADHNGTPEELASFPYHLFLTNSRACAAKLQQAGRAAAYWPLYTDPRLFYPVPPVPEYECEVVYVGGNMSFKTPVAVERFLEPCTAFDFHLWGLDWELHPTLRRCHRGLLPEGRIHEVYSSAKVVVGFNAPSQARWGMMNNRVFEALASGACLLSDRLPEIEQEFTGACAFTDGGEDTVRQLRVLLADDDLRRRLGQAGRERVLARHTVQQRIDTLFALLPRARRRASSLIPAGGRSA